MTCRRSLVAVLGACVAVAGAPAVASAASAPRASFELSAAGKRALAARSITVAAVPRGPSRQPSFAVGSWTVGASARIALGGSLRFSAGRRRVSATRLSITIGRTSSYVTARLGGRSLRLFTVRPARPAQLDRGEQRASLTGARIALTSAAATRLKSALRLRRAPSTATLGKLTIAVAAPAPTPTPAPAPAVTPTPTPLPLDNDILPLPTPTPTATPTATPLATATPGPSLACDDRFAATPVGIVDWFSCDLPGSQDLKSWTSYILTLPGGPCPGAPGSVTAGFGASEVVAGDPFDHRFPVLSSTVRGDGSATIVVGGWVTYAKPLHGIDERIGSFRIEIDAGGLTGTVYADGHFKELDIGGAVCATPTQDYAGLPVLTLDLSATPPVTAGGVTRWTHVPAAIASAAGPRIGGGGYAAGRPWGSFTIAVPAG